MPSAEEVERISPEYEEMERWRLKPRALTEGLDFLIAHSANGLCCDGSKQGALSLSERTSEGYSFFGHGTPPAGSRNRGHCWVPRNEAESEEQFRFRLNHLTSLDSDFDDAIADIYGAILPKPIQLEVDGPEAMQEALDEFAGNVDRNGQSLDAFVAGLAQDSVPESLSYVWVDSTAGDSPLPKWKQIKARQVPYVELVTDSETGQTVLGVVDIELRSTKGERIRRIYTRGNPGVVPGRAEQNYLRYVTYRVLRHRDDKEVRGTEQEWEDITAEVVESQGLVATVVDDLVVGVMLPPNALAPEDERTFVEVPLYPFYSGYLSPHFAKPRHIKLAELVLLKTLKQSNLEGFLHWCGMPREQFIGGTLQELVEANELGDLAAGKGNVIATGDPDKRLEMYEHEGTASRELRESLENLQQRIDRATANVMLKEATGRELVGVSALKEQRKVTRLHVDAEWWKQGVQWAVDRTMLWLAGSGSTAAVSFPDPSPWRLLGSQVSGQRVVDLMADGKLSAQTGLEMLCLLNELPKPEGWAPEDEPGRLAAELT